MPSLNIGGLEIEVPIIQGGMGVGISLRNLASTVTNEGGLGIIASVGLGLLKHYPGSYAEGNTAALKDEIQATRKLSDGIIGVNIMNALTDYDSLVKTSVDKGVPLLFTGAGFDKNLPDKIKGSSTMAVPIISYGRFAGNICNEWCKNNYLPAAIVVEGPKAGGHLGFSRKTLERPGFIDSSLEREVKRAVKEVAKFGNIPIIAAGGIYTGADVYEALDWGASGVQMGTRFVVTNECDASPAFKNEYLRATKDDIILIDSPVGFPGRAIRNEFLGKVERGVAESFGCGYRCLKGCDPKVSSYCIAHALTEANVGDFTRGYAFAGANAYRCEEIIPVKKLMDTLKDEYAAAARK